MDFYCPAARLVVELDGDAHFTPEARAYDAGRTAHLESLGLLVLRFTNLEVYQNLEGVCHLIEQAARERTAPLEAEPTLEG